jgi:hypothetical protein
MYVSEIVREIELFAWKYERFVIKFKIISFRLHFCYIINRVFSYPLLLWKQAVHTVMKDTQP